MKGDGLADVARAASSQALAGRQPYYLEVLGEERINDISVVSFRVNEKMGQPYRIDLVATHSQQLTREVILGHEAWFRMMPDDGSEPRLFWGRITRFSHTKTTKDQSHYEIVVEPHIGCLTPRTTQTYQHSSAPEIIEAILRRNGLKGHDFIFRLRRQYPKHKFRFQYQLGDWNYINMLMQQEGIYSYIVPGKFGDVVVFGDDIDHYIYEPTLTVPSRAISGFATDSESVWALRTHTTMVPESYVVADYNPDQAWERFRAEANVARKDTTTFGKPYIYGTHHLNASGAQWEAQLRHEAALAWQVVYEGESNVHGLCVGRILRTDADLPDAPHGQVMIEITHTGARDQPYRNTYMAIPSDRRFRLKFEDDRWPRIIGSLSARVTSPDRYKYAYLTQQGYYVVRFDCDYGEWPAGSESVPLRLAKPFAGGLQTGFHFPALDGTEAVIQFENGDPNRPFIAAFQHNSQQTDLITNQERRMSRNVIRTQSDNKFELEDWEGQEHAKLSTEHSGKSQLNLGHIVNGKREHRGSGMELRTDAQGAVRAGGGLVLSTDRQERAQGKHTDMSAALSQMQTALAQAQGLAQAASIAKAEIADLKAENEWLRNSLSELKEAVMLLSSPKGIALATPDRVSVAAGKDVNATTSAGFNVSALRNIVLAAVGAVSVFAQKSGLKLFAGSGMVEIQAQNDAMQLASEQDMTIQSVNGRVVIEAKKELVLKCGGSYLRMTSTGIEDATRGDRTWKAAAFNRQGPASLPAELPVLPKPAATQCALRAGSSGMPFAKMEV
ncbi:type VI secretion system Vgr family protein [Paraburkholderia aspalathi]|uniref:type VI secretion system Vgr family protein n=1 Tax=Paraburkholderia aspalathi TaxID=1324617 RepID=UPI0038BD1FAD